MKPSEARKKYVIGKCPRCKVFDGWSYFKCLECVHKWMDRNTTLKRKHK